jgi:ribosomal protein L22
MSKKAHERALAENEAQAVARMLRVSPQKLNLVAGLIRGKKVATAFTTYGTCGVKVWIFKGEILEHDPMAQDKKMAEGDGGRPRRDAA